VTAQLNFEPFRVAIPDADLVDLTNRVTAARRTAQLPGTPGRRAVTVACRRRHRDCWSTARLLRDGHLISDFGVEIRAQRG
jgi:hypothetical protein